MKGSLYIFLFPFFFPQCVLLVPLDDACKLDLDSICESYLCAVCGRLSGFTSKHRA